VVLDLAADAEQGVTRQTRVHDGLVVVTCTLHVTSLQHGTDVSGHGSSQVGVVMVLDGDEVVSAGARHTTVHLAARFAHG
jgi:hypothetical protein